MQELKVKKDENDKTILIKDLDIVVIDFRPYGVFVALYIFNATLALPILILKMILMYLITLVKLLKYFRLRQVVSSTVYYAIDIALAMSVLSMYVFASTETKDYSINYQYWAIAYLLFLQSQILLSSYMQTLDANKTSLSLYYLISDDNARSLGLGRLVHKFEQSNKTQAQIKLELQKSLYDFVNNAMEQENIDSTLYYFALDSDHGVLSASDFATITDDKLEYFINQAKLALAAPIIFEKTERIDFEENDRKLRVLSSLKMQGFRGERHAIENLLWPHYEYIKMTMRGTSPTTLALIVIVIIIMKGLYPSYTIYLLSDDPNMEYFMAGCFIGMQINMITLLIGLVVNDDLKGKRYILNVLETMMIPTQGPDQDMDEMESDEHKEAPPPDLPFNNRYKIDLSCNLSLESWDNVRRLTLLMDNEKMEFNEATFAFLALYFFYTYLNLSSVFLDFDLIPALHHFFNDPILISNMTIDFAMLGLLFLNRVHQGTLFNQTFDRIHETTKQIAIIYDDKKALFEFYFSSNMMENIQNQTYRQITQKIYCAAADKVLFGLAAQGIKTITVNEFLILAKSQAKQRVAQLCATMSKLSVQIEFDSEHFAHKMLGVFKSNIAKVVSTFFLLFYIFFRQKIKAYMNAHKIKTK